MKAERGKTRDQLPSHVPYLCVACCLASLAPMQRVGPTGFDTGSDRYIGFKTVYRL